MTYKGSCDTISVSLLKPCRFLRFPPLLLATLFVWPWDKQSVGLSKRSRQPSGFYKSLESSSDELNVIKRHTDRRSSRAALFWIRTKAFEKWTWNELTEQRKKRTKHKCENGFFLIFSFSRVSVCSESQTLKKRTSCRLHSDQCGYKVRRRAALFWIQTKAFEKGNTKNSQNNIKC